MARKRVHVITKYFYPVAAGIETNILETYSVLARKWDITVHTTKDEYVSKNSLADTEELRGLTIKRYPFHSEFLGFKPDIDYKQADIVALHNFNIFFLWFFLRTWWHRLTRVVHYKLIVTPHGGYNPEWRMFKQPLRFIKAAYHYTLGKVFLNHIVDRIRCVSEWEKLEMVKKGISAKKIFVISNGLENEAFVDVDKHASNKIKKYVQGLGEYIIQVGRIYPIKNYETVIRALPQVPGIKYVIVGQVEKSKQYRDYQASLIQLASDLGVADRLVFAGVLRGVDKYYLMKHAAMMVHMAIWESYCNVVHEGLSQGLICIVADNTALPLLVKEGINGYTVGTYDHKKLAKRIEYVLKNKSSAKTRAMKKNNRNTGSDDSWHHVANKMFALYNT